jgi:hypothetical protein
MNLLASCDFFWLVKIYSVNIIPVFKKTTLVQTVFKKEPVIEAYPRREKSNQHIHIPSCFILHPQSISFSLLLCLILLWNVPSEIELF